MYPQQHQQHHVPFTNLPQNYFAISYPLSCDSSLHPPGTDPHGNSSLYLPNSTPAAVYGAQFVKQAESIQFDHGVGSSSHDTSSVCASFLSTWNGTWAQQYYTNDMAVVLPNQETNITTMPMRCEVCKINCNSKDVYEKHVSGKKHKRNLVALTNPSQGSLLQIYSSSIEGGQALTGAVGGKELESKRQKILNGGAPSDSVRTCTYCNVVCNSQDVFNKHLAGKKHAAQVALMSNNGIGPYIAAFKNQGIGPWKKPLKKIKFVQPICCEVCKINCNSRDMYITHLAGKKHLKNLEKLSKPQIEAGAGGATTSNPIIGPKEKPETHKPKSNEEMDIDAKKQKVVEGGAPATDIKMCTLCNVVCNSQTVFDAHLAGHKHAAIVKKQGSTGS